MNNIALVDGRPQMLPMRDLIKYFIEHRHDVVVRRTRFDKRKAEERLHIVQGLLIAQDNIDEIDAHHPRLADARRRQADDDRAFRVDRTVQASLPSSKCACAP